MGTALYLTACIVGYLNMEYTTSWDTALGQNWQSVTNAGLMPAVVLGYIFIAAGVVLSLWGAFEKRAARGSAASDKTAMKEEQKQ